MRKVTKVAEMRSQSVIEQTFIHFYNKDIRERNTRPYELRADRGKINEQSSNRAIICEDQRSRASQTKESQLFFSEEGFVLYAYSRRAVFTA
ncbi:hypothetical protein GCM10008018_61300 [Paenibacillus marchantiophytorum]|uniref:Integrase catalytic domain-containing protein n=1 Tax=Paenibacillus marchantiophytorum TaxID=1619310 RepID=A0ABQ1FDY7_9BACL|nr:hypothetical protein GCM10008018_61300 [Paenibacillus marchantiophytorum]